MQQKIIIIGAGIAGLTTGISLKKLGFKIKIYESNEQIKGIGAGIGLAANAMKALRYLELDQGISNFGTKLEASHIRDLHGKTISIANTNLVSDLEDENFAVHRQQLHQYLYDQLEPNEVVPHKKALKFNQVSEKVFIEFKDGTSDTGDFLIGVDGIGSIIRNVLIPDSKPRYAGYTCWRAVIKNPGLKLEESSEIWGKEGRFGYVSLPGNIIYWYACVNTKKRKTDSWSVDHLLANFSNYAEPIPTLLKNTKTDKLIKNDIIDIKPLKNFAFNRILLIGDAAHATTPNMGQGACMALEDVAVLIHELKLESNVKEAFINFEKKRLKRTKYIIENSRIIGLIAQFENPLLIQIRNLVFRKMPKSFIKKQLEILLKTDIFNP